MIFSVHEEACLSSAAWKQNQFPDLSQLLVLKVRMHCCQSSNPPFNDDLQIILAELLSGNLDSILSLNEQFKFLVGFQTTADRVIRFVFHP
jgi:hypothetical protein